MSGDRRNTQGWRHLTGRGMCLQSPKHVTWACEGLRPPADRFRSSSNIITTHATRPRVQSLKQHLLYEGHSGYRRLPWQGHLPRPPGLRPGWAWGAAPRCTPLTWAWGLHPTAPVVGRFWGVAHPGRSLDVGHQQGSQGWQGEGHTGQTWAPAHPQEPKVVLGSVLG